MKILIETLDEKTADCQAGFKLCEGDYCIGNE